MAKNDKGQTGYIPSPYVKEHNPLVCVTKVTKIILEIRH